MFVNLVGASGGGGHRSTIIFGPWQQVVIIGLYSLILVLGLVFNTAIAWVIVGKYFRFRFNPVSAQNEKLNQSTERTTDFFFA